MTTPTWPTALPQQPLAGKWSWAPQRNKVSFQPEIGPSIDRRRGSSNVRIYQGTFDFPSVEIAAIFEDWFEATLSDGTLPFQWVDPVSQGLYLWKFSPDDQPYQIVVNRNSFHEMTCKLHRLSAWNGS